MKSDLTCLYCSKINKDPIELPCKDNICSEHLKENSVVKQNKISCPKCKQEFEVKENVFENNKILQKLLECSLFEWRRNSFKRENERVN